jgi:hypothetical protein
MTKDEILNMPAGREMDALIEKEVIKEFYTFHGEYPSYSTNIASAWEVVEKMLNTHSMNITAHHPEKDFICQIWPAHDIGGDFTVRAASSSLAICRAALLAAMADEV